MLVRDICNRNIISVDAGSTAAEAAKIMRSKHVGCVVVMAQNNGRSELKGILTDRDIVIGCVAADLQASDVSVEQLISNAPITINHCESLDAAVKLMSKHAIRRLPVLTDAGDLFGLISADDLMRETSREMSDLAHIIDAKILKRESSGTESRRQLHAR